MKAFSLLLAALISLPIVTTNSQAREFRNSSGGGGGGFKRSKTFTPKAGGGNFQRSPLTNSRISRPAPQQITQPTPRPASKPNQSPVIQRPSVQKPTIKKPETKPTINRPNLNKPQDKPNLNRPGINQPNQKPNFLGNGSGNFDKRPSIERPGGNRPSTLPGMVSYPNKPDKGKLPDLGKNGKPNLGDKKPFKPGNSDRNRFEGKPNLTDRNIRSRGDINIGNGNRNQVHIDKVNVGRRNVGLNRPSTLPAGKRNWDSRRWGGNNSVWGSRVNIGNNVNVHVNNRYYHNNNFACRPGYWGSRPWWGSGNYHTWHHGHWGYGWNSNYYHRHWYYNDNDFASGFMWGIAVWSLGNLVYDMGYQSYHNPYKAPPVQNTYINYSEPISVAAAKNPPGDETAAATAEEKSNAALEASRAAFKSGDYVTALTKCDEALSATPGDGTLHEYRALIYFTLGKYAEAAGILNPVLASGPGWGWDTMITFYNSSQTYSDQLIRLANHTKNSNTANCHFLLGYHYLVCGHLEESHAEFTSAAKLQPADTISVQMRNLTASSIPDGGDASDTAPEPQPTPVPPDQLVGTWTTNTDSGTITFTMKDSGDYSWKFAPKQGDSTELTGTYGLDDKGLLVLSGEDSQMVSMVELKDPKHMHFTLIGAPDGDPGLDFSKS